MKLLIITTFLLTISLVSYATGISSEPNFCELLGAEASIVAQNRDNGIEEYDLSGKYLSERKSYDEQSVVIPLIDRVYGVKKDISSEDIAFIEQQRCEITLVHFIE